MTVGLFVALAIAAILLQWDDINDVASRANWNWTPYAILFAGISYLLIGYNFFRICRIFGLKIKTWELIKIGYVTYSLDSLLPALGLPGLSLVVLLLSRHGAGTGEAVAPTLFRSYFNNVIFIAILPFALVYTLVSYSMPQAEATALVIAAVVIVLFAVAITAMVFSAWLRERLMRLINKAWRFFIRRDIEKSLQKFGETFAQGIEKVRRSLKQDILLTGTVLMFWLVTAVVIWFCFRALNSNLDYGLILTGFLIGRTLGVISFLPGGLGTQDASMVGFYALFGVPIAQAVLIALLFRVVYYFIPFAISLLFYRNLLRGLPEATMEKRTDS